MAAEAKLKISMGAGGWSGYEERQRLLRSVREVEVTFIAGRDGRPVAATRGGKIILPASREIHVGERWLGRFEDMGRYLRFRPIKRVSKRIVQSGDYAIVDAGNRRIALVQTKFGVARLENYRGVDFKKFAEVVERFEGKLKSDVFASKDYVSSLLQVGTVDMQRMENFEFSAGEPECRKHKFEEVQRNSPNSIRICKKCGAWRYATKEESLAGRFAL